MKKIFDLSYWFNALPGSPNLPFWRSIIILSTVLIVGGIALAFIAGRTKDGIRRKLWYKFCAWACTVGPVFLIIAFFRLQNAYILSMRVWVFGWIGFSILWLLFIVKYWILDMPKKLKKRVEQQSFEKYLPHKK